MPFMAKQTAKSLSCRMGRNMISGKIRQGAALTCLSAVIFKQSESITSHTCKGTQERKQKRSVLSGIRNKKAISYAESNKTPRKGIYGVFRGIPKRKAKPKAAKRGKKEPCNSNNGKQESLGNQLKEIFERMRGS